LSRNLRSADNTGGHMKIFLFPTIVLLLLASGCTRRNAYDALRIQQEMSCQQQGVDRDDCARRHGMSYDEYQKQLQEREKNKQQQ